MSERTAVPTADPKVDVQVIVTENNSPEWEITGLFRDTGYADGTREEIANAYGEDLADLLREWRSEESFLTAELTVYVLPH